MWKGMWKFGFVKQRNRVELGDFVELDVLQEIDLDILCDLDLR